MSPDNGHHSREGTTMHRSLPITDRSRLGTVAVALAVTLMLSACTGWSFDLNDEIVGSGDVVTQVRSADGFDRIDFRAFGTVEISQGDDESLTVRGDDNLLSRIHTFVEDDTLVVEIEDGIVPIPSDGFRYEIRVVDLEGLEVSGAGRVTLDGFRGDALGVDFSGAGDIDLVNLDLDVLDVSFSGAGTMYASGRADAHEANLSGAGDYDAGALATRTTSISSSGAGSAEVWATVDLEIDASGVGRVRYWGSPNTEITSSGIGGIDELGDK